jgi:hypothetical protein
MLYSCMMSLSRGRIQLAIAVHLAYRERAQERILLRDSIQSSPSPPTTFSESNLQCECEVAVFPFYVTLACKNEDFYVQ